jgi:hypothetical protein
LDCSDKGSKIRYNPITKISDLLVHNLLMPIFGVLLCTSDLFNLLKPIFGVLPLALVIVYLNNLIFTACRFTYANFWWSSVTTCYS